MTIKHTAEYNEIYIITNLKLITKDTSFLFVKLENFAR